MLLVSDMNRIHSFLIFFAHGLEIQLWQSSRPQFDTLSVQEYSEKSADPIALHFVFLVHACLGRDLDSTAPNLALICCSIFDPGGKYAHDVGRKICHWQEILQIHRKLQQYPKYDKIKLNLNN
ncbi:hypothetical protein GQ457_04G025910 [Hibiscus cannabinus]